MKKLLFIALLLALALGCACALAEDHAHTGGTATCDARAVCTVCGQSYGRLADHSWGAWVSDGDSTHTRTCRTNSGHTETRYHSGGASTCTQGAKCVYCGAVHDAPLGHISTNYPGYAATCISAGATDGEKCSRCGDVLTPRRVINARGHSFNTWEPLPGGLHTAVCAVSSCGESGVVPCTPFEVTVDGAPVTVCPICGVTGEVVLPMLLSRADEALPMGQLLVRGAADVCGAYYAFTVAGSYAGNVIELDGKTVVTLPEDLSALPACKLVRLDVTPATADAERTEALTDVPFRMSNGQLTFTAEVGGLYLLVFAE